jgi:hypothetical protein
LRLAILGRKQVRKKGSFPKTRLSKPHVIGRQRVNLSAPSLQNQLAIFHLPNDPVLVNFIRVHFTMWRWRYILSSGPWRKTVLLPRIDDPIVWTERPKHVARLRKTIKPGGSRRSMKANHNRKCNPAEPEGWKQYPDRLFFAVPPTEARPGYGS